MPLAPYSIPSLSATSDADCNCNSSQPRWHGDPHITYTVTLAHLSTLLGVFCVHLMCMCERMHLAFLQNFWHCATALPAFPISFLEVYSSSYSDVKVFVFFLITVSSCHLETLN